MPESSVADLLIEIGTEELPPKALSRLADAFEENIVKNLSALGFNALTSQQFSTPRRLAVHVANVPLEQKPRSEQRRGPAIKAAFDKDGNPSKAATGFAQSVGKKVEELGRVATEKGEWLAFTRTIPGSATADCLQQIIATALQELPIPKRMRWGDRTDEFVRPVHWLLVLLDSKPVPVSLFGQTAGTCTYGHRFHHPDPITINSAAEYLMKLEEPGKVIADGNKRKERIRELVSAAASEIGARAVISDDLLNEVNSLVEWPVAVLGDFEARFLNVPQEALITTMRDNQKYFPIVDQSGTLQPHFITVSNIESKDPAQVREGNERVIRPRFSDAEFFWNQDLKVSLDSHRESLKAVIFQHKLGSLYDKSERVKRIIKQIAATQHLNSEHCSRAAELAKCDLLSAMVQEFPSLQGTMGRYYAARANEPGDIAAAIEEQYQPRFAGDELPKTPTGQALALAERLDTLVGIFSIGQPPTGTKDPFALRRSALGIVRLLIELQWDLPLMDLINVAASELPPTNDMEPCQQAVFDFIVDRLRAYYADQGIHSDVLEAALSREPESLNDFDRRVKAIALFRQQPEAPSLAAANKRIQNILRKSAAEAASNVNEKQLTAPEEQALNQRLQELESQTELLFRDGQYTEALQKLAQLQVPVDKFFDAVMVMDDDLAIRANRLALLDRLSKLFLRTGDFSRLQS